jgi:deoxyribonuclease V
MIVKELHPWKVTTAEAREIQERLRHRVCFDPPSGNFRLIAGADVSYNKFSPDLYASVVVIDLETRATIEELGIKEPAGFPYVPGLLSFREAPPLLRLFGRLRTRPDAVVCDGHGYAHPRRFGLACHLGLLLDLPTLGCAKTRLIGDYAPPPTRRGGQSPLREGEEIIGAVLRTRSGVQPVFVSVGHRMSLELACEIVLGLCPRFRLPETTRRAHLRVNELRRSDARQRTRSGPKISTPPS